jgi:hypothetical protein
VIYTLRESDNMEDLGVDKRIILMDPRETGWKAVD